MTSASRLPAERTPCAIKVSAQGNIVELDNLASSRVVLIEDSGSEVIR
jgi:hypothetical protein